MRISDILRVKGTEVHTIPMGAPVADATAALAVYNIGALVVTDVDGQMIGILSERDVVRHLHERGAGVLAATVREVMSSNVTTCAPDTTIDQAMRTMTDQRMRHLPVIDESGLIGLVSIGDIVKNRIDELQTTTDQLSSYISS